LRQERPVLRRFVLAIVIGAITEALVTGVLISYLGVSQHPSILVGIVVGLTAVAAVFAATRSKEGRHRAKATAPLDAEDIGEREIPDARKT
jgi:NhaP-type Na+/H+ and K+/H+ antiporter